MLRLRPLTLALLVASGMVAAGCSSPAVPEDATVDAGGIDGGREDGAVVGDGGDDGGGSDGGAIDGGADDGGLLDGGDDGGAVDGGDDGGLPDGAADDGGLLDGAADDGGRVDGGGLDGGLPDGGPPAGPRITLCPGDALPPPATGTCTVTAGGPALLVTGDVLTPGEVLRGGQVLVDGAGVIACVGCDCTASPAAPGATAIVCPDGVVSPGLINAHDHLGYAHNLPQPDTGERYEHRHDWRTGARGHTQLVVTPGASVDQIRWAELRSVMGGATSVKGAGGAAGFLRNLDRTGLLEGLAQPLVRADPFPLGDASGLVLASGCGYPDIRLASEIAGDEAYVAQVAEGIGAEAGNELACIRSGTTDLIQPQSAFVHAIALLPPDAAELASQGTALIWTPRSDVSLYGDTARVTEHARLGGLIALGTDWIATGSMNLLRELRCADALDAQYWGDFFDDEALWRMATVDAAAAMALDDAIGVLAPGRAGDLAIFEASGRTDHRAILDAEPGDVVLVVRGGTPLYGDAALIAALPGGGATCDALDVCGVAKRACVSAQVGRTLAALTASVGTVYPLFACGPPALERACVPARPVSVGGSTVYTGVPTAADADGDGIADAADDCPGVFDPIRPLDEGAQADSDGDGVGDACDPCLLTAGTTACAP